MWGLTVRARGKKLQGEKFGAEGNAGKPSNNYILCLENCNNILKFPDIESSYWGGLIFRIILCSNKYDTCLVFLIHVDLGRTETMAKNF